jgi:hypothetical protein
MRFSDVDDAVSRANATRFGLGGSVWSADLDRARDIATRLECGTVWVNEHGITHPEVPLGGMKWSGIGYENGLAGLDAYTAFRQCISHLSDPVSYKQAKFRSAPPIFLTGVQFRKGRQLINRPRPPPLARIRLLEF